MHGSMIEVGRSRRWMGAVVVVSVLALTSCTQAQLGMGLATMNRDDARMAIVRAGAEVQSLRGRLDVASDGCAVWRPDGALRIGAQAWIVWPDGSSREDEGHFLVDGERVSDGDTLEVTAGLIQLRDIPEGADPQSMLGSHGAYCDADDNGVLLVLGVNSN